MTDMIAPLLTYLGGCGIVLAAGYARLAWVLWRDRRKAER